MILAKALALLGLLVTETFSTNLFLFPNDQGVSRLLRDKRESPTLKSKEIDGLLKNQKNSNGGLADNNDPALRNVGQRGQKEYFYDGCFRCVSENGNVVCKENKVGCSQAQPGTFIPYTKSYTSDPYDKPDKDDQYSIVKIKSACWKCNVQKPWLPCELFDPCPISKISKILNN